MANEPRWHDRRWQHGSPPPQAAVAGYRQAFIVSFGVVKACANLVSGQLADAWGRKRVLILGWLVGLPVPFMIMWGRRAGDGSSQQMPFSASTRVSLGR